MNLTIRSKLIGIIVILIVFIIVVGAGGVYTNYRITESFDMTDNLATADRLARIALIGGIVSISIAILLSLILGAKLYRDIVRPLSRLREAAHKIAIGQLDEKIKIEGRNEIGELANSFNIMAATLKESYNTLEKKVEERTNALEELSMKNETLLQSIGDGVIAIDFAWNIILWNKAAENLTGWTREEVLGKPFRDFVHFIRERDRSENIVFIQNALLFGQAKFMENHTILIKRDKTEIPVGDSASPIINLDKKIVGAVIVFRDLSQEVSSQVLKTDFKYASHQMRTPVTKILWNLEAAIGATSEADRKSYIKNAYDSAASISKMSDQLLTVAEIDQNLVITHYAITKLADLIATVFSKLDYMVKRKNMKLDYISPSSITLETDNKLLEGVLLELIDNSLRYNEDESTVTVEVQQREADILIEIRDTGIGITEEQQPLVFTKFFRGTNYDTGKIPGAGLGLFVSKSYIGLLGGKLWFNSEPEKGTSFFISLPRVRQ